MVLVWTERSIWLSVASSRVNLEVCGQVQRLQESQTFLEFTKKMSKKGRKEGFATFYKKKTITFGSFIYE